MIVPSDFAAFEAGVDAETLAAILAGPEEQWWDSIELSLPRFELESTHRLDGPLMQLGMVAPFVDEGSFTDIVDIGLVVRPVVQQTVLKVDEGGVEAAAATGIVGTRPPSIPPSFRVDRPFLLAIHDMPTNALLFFGRVLEPQG